MTEDTISQDQPSHSVVYSFFNKWEGPLRSGKVNVFFRKRFPSRKPSRVYFYIGAPSKAIIGSARVSSIQRLPVKQALALAKEGCIDQAELAAYLGNKDSVGAIFLEDFDFFKSPVSLSNISQAITFSPPQNFQNLDDADEALLRELAR